MLHALAQSQAPLVRGVAQFLRPERSRSRWHHVVVHPFQICRANQSCDVLRRPLVRQVVARVVTRVVAEAPDEQLRQKAESLLLASSLLLPCQVAKLRVREAREALGALALEKLSSA